MMDTLCEIRFDLRERGGQGGSITSHTRGTRETTGERGAGVGSGGGRG